MGKFSDLARHVRENQHGLPASLGSSVQPHVVLPEPEARPPAPGEEIYLKIKALIDEGKDVDQVAMLALVYVEDVSGDKTLCRRYRKAKDNIVDLENRKAKVKELF